MAKPATINEYTDEYTVNCERVLVTLLRGLGPWKESMFLIGGLTPRPPAVGSPAGPDRIVPVSQENRIRINMRKKRGRCYIALGIVRVPEVRDDI